MGRPFASPLGTVAWAAWIVVGLVGVSIVPAAGPTFAPGILTTIPPAPEAEELFTGPRPLVELPIVLKDLQYEPQLAASSSTSFAKSEKAILRRTIWNLEFSFKPMRMIYVDVPQASGRMQRQLVWYMVYRVRNLGGHWRPKGLISQEVLEAVKEGQPLPDANAELAALVRDAGGDLKRLYESFKETTNEVEMFGRKTTELRFFPHFVLAAPEFNKEYLDRVIPAALEPIRRREFAAWPDQKLYDSLTISEVPLPVSTPEEDHSVWGVATWVDVDLRIDYFMVYVQGLTNAYRFEDPPGAFKAGDPPGTGRKITRKTLQLNFWRPGDAVNPREDEIFYGCRLDPDPAEQREILSHYGVDRPIDHVWVYR